MNIPRRSFLGTAVAAGSTVLGAGRLWSGSGESAGASAATAQSDDEGEASRSGVRYVPPDDGVEGIQEAIDDAGPNVTVELDRGEYVGSELELEDGVQLVGLGRNATIVELESDADTDLVETLEPDEQAVRQVRFENVTLDGNGDENSSGALIYGAFWNSRFVDCDFVNAPETGVWLAGSSGGSTDDNYLRGCRFIDGGGDALRQGGNRESFPAVGVSRVESCWFGHNEGRAVSLRGNANVVSNSKFYGNGGPGVYIDRGTRNRVVNNDMAKETSAEPCVSVRAAHGVDAVANQVSGNVFDGSFREAVHAFTDGNAIVALQVHDNSVNATPSDTETRRGIYAEDGTYRGCSARNNTFVGEFEEEEVIDLPDSWELSGNIVTDAAE